MNISHQNVYITPETLNVSSGHWFPSSGYSLNTVVKIQNTLTIFSGKSVTLRKKSCMNFYSLNTHILKYNVNTYPCSCISEQPLITLTSHQDKKNARSKAREAAFPDGHIAL